MRLQFIRLYVETPASELSLINCVKAAGGYDGTITRFRGGLYINARVLGETALDAAAALRRALEQSTIPMEFIADLTPPRETPL
ncbi:hypothetical protein KIKIMORA_00080 [Brevundimonas phage vB_BpoS-Kikimora]|uniref:Uncharacterized protein n=1 Tax=Brevundimonas phage vB_BpoS-Kikimora TaxID=2948601 RepID=A0A9E7MS86_9CAUD|nr:hypothetical protein KIKIMORA_00080 [Brevundimonas phage vB_BpoS-Kikimora]